MKPPHTPTPWTLHTDIGKHCERYIWRDGIWPSGACVAIVQPAITREDEKTLDYPWTNAQENADANAAYIVHAANMYPKLIEALKQQKAYLDAIVDTRRKWTSADQRNYERVESMLKECEG